MSKITRRKSPRLGSSKGKQNPFQNRGMDKFNEVYSELEKLRASIAAEEGVSTSDVWFTRGTSKGRDWVPVVVGRSRSSSMPSPRQDSQSFSVLDKHNSSAETKTDDGDVASDQASVEEESHSLKDCSKQPWVSAKFEQLVYELQHGTRKALKAITLFIMIVAAVVDVLIAVVAGITSSFIARHLRPLWARYLPVNFPQQHNSDLVFEPRVAVRSLAPSCVSAPTSPRQPHQFGSGGSFSSIGSSCRTTSASTPVSPVRSCSTFFSSDKPQEVGSPAHRHQPRNHPFESEQQGGRPAHRHQSEGGIPAHRHQTGQQQGGSPAQRHQAEQQQGGSPAHRHQAEQQGGSPAHRQQRNHRLNHLQQQEELESCGGGNGGGAVQVMVIVVVILLGLSSTGMLAATMFASMAWFVFPVARRVSSKPSSRTVFQHGELRKGLSI